MLSTRGSLLQIQDALVAELKRLDEVRCDRCWHWTPLDGGGVGQCQRMKVVGGKPTDETSVAHAVARGNASVQTASDFACSMWERRHG
jgi:hypothetical protein